MWKLTNKVQAKNLQCEFDRLEIDYSQPGFCDSPAFLSAEQNNHRILVEYGHFIETREYSAEYLIKAKKQIEIVAECVRRVSAATNAVSNCVQSAGLVGRMLDQLGIWNYQAKATMTIEFSRSLGFETVFFWAIDEGKFFAPHAIVVAPPFGVVDVSIQFQPYSDARERSALPDKVLGDKFLVANYSPEDIVNTEILRDLRSHRVTPRQFLNARYRHMLDVMEKLPARSVTHEGTTIKYVIIAGAGMEETLEHLTWTIDGRKAIEIFQQDVLPKINSIQS